MKIKTIMMQDIKTHEKKFGFQVEEISISDPLTDLPISRTPIGKKKDAYIYSYEGTVLTDCKTEISFSKKFVGKNKHAAVLKYIFSNMPECSIFELILKLIVEHGPNGEIDGDYIDWNEIRAALVKTGFVTR